MIPASFDYHRATSVNDALNLLKKHKDASFLAGGHSLLPAMKLRLSTPGHLIDISGIGALKEIKELKDQIVIGAAVTHHEIESSKPVLKKAPLLAQAAAVIGDIQVRNVGTIGGSLAHADPAADYPAAVLAAGASIRVKGSKGDRTIAAADFFQDLFMTDLKAGEIILDIRIPLAPSKTGTSYQKFPHPASRFAVCGCAASVTLKGGKCTEARVGFTGIANAAFRDSSIESALVGKALDEATVAAACEGAASDADLLSDSFAGEDYRRHLAKLFAKKAILAAVEAA